MTNSITKLIANTKANMEATMPINKYNTNEELTIEKQMDKVADLQDRGHELASSLSADDIEGREYLEQLQAEFEMEDQKLNDMMAQEEELTMTNPETNVTHEVINMDNMNKSALVSTMAGDLYHAGLNPMQSLLVAAAFIGATDYIEYMEEFMDELTDGLSIANINIKGGEGLAEADTGLDGDEVMEALVKARYLTEEGMGDRLVEICSQRTEAYLPIEAGSEWTRRFNYSRNKVKSDLFIEAIHALESTEYTVDDGMLSIALQVQAKMGGEDNDPESYVLRGCQKMDSTKGYISEFKGDGRDRMYQASCHGPNGQSSDRSRALMNLKDVPTDYNIEVVKQAVRAEVMDMVNVSSKEVGKLMTAAIKNPVDFIVDQLEKKEAGVEQMSKPWSFTKAAMIWKELAKGNRPYIGMAVGLDAKCSGPQLGALIVGDKELAAACGFTMEQLPDAYHRTIVQLEKAGFHGLERADVKKPFMGVFYGQGWAAFTNKDEVNDACWTAMYGSGPANDDVAKRFHKAIVASFGSKLNAIRNAIKGYGKKTKGRTLHFMPDGSQVEMNYKCKVNIFNEVMDYETESYDVIVENGAEAFKFINFQMNTLDTNEGDFARNGFVNMIQATDALIAKLIIVNLKRLGAKHIISVHDCFRVNVTEMHLLEQAIKNAYKALFGYVENYKSADLPMGTDILGMYFEGANKQLVDEFKGDAITTISQFRTTTGKRKFPKIQGKYLSQLIEELGTTYYFSK